MDVKATRMSVRRGKLAKNKEDKREGKINERGRPTREEDEREREVVGGV